MKQSTGPALTPISRFARRRTSDATMYPYRYQAWLHISLNKTSARRKVNLMRHHSDAEGVTSSADGPISPRLTNVRICPLESDGQPASLFVNHWLAAGDGDPIRVLLGTVDAATPRSNYFVFKADEGNVIVVADDHAGAQKLALAMTCKRAISVSIPCWVFKTDVPPFVPASMPLTGAELSRPGTPSSTTLCNASSRKKSTT